MWKAEPDLLESDADVPRQSESAAQVEVPFDRRLDPLHGHAHRGRDHLAGDLGAGGERSQQRVSRACRCRRPSDSRVGLRFVDRPADVHGAGDRRRGLAPGDAQRDARGRWVGPILLLERLLQRPDVHFPIRTEDKIEFQERPFPP
jgi:hypothetical protein